MKSAETAHLSQYQQFYVVYNREDYSVFHSGSIPSYLAPSHHFHNVDEIMLITEGDSLITCERTVTHVTGPYIVYYPAGVPHYQDNSASHIYERWCFPIFSSDIGCRTELPDHYFVLPLTDDQCSQLRTYINIMYRHYGVNGWRNMQTEQMRLLSPHEMLRLKYLLLLFLNEMKPLLTNAVTGKSDCINDVCLYISEHPDENLSLNSLAERFFIGRTTLTRDFRRTMDMSVVDFITTVRVNRAKELLAKNLPLSVIAEQCGFSSASYMIKVFTRRTGLTPKEYRLALEC